MLLFVRTQRTKKRDNNTSEKYKCREIRIKCEREIEIDTQRSRVYK